MTIKLQKAVLLIGSPKGKNSASMALGKRLLAALSSRGITSETHIIRPALDSEEKTVAMGEAVEKADIVIFSFPLYVDQLPAPVIWALERIAERRKEITSTSRPWLIALVQSGLGETHHNQPAIEIMRRFADLTGFRWAGGLAMGMGGAMIGGKPGQRDRKLRNVFCGLDLAAAELAEGWPIPDEAVSLLGRKLMPRWLYVIGGNFGWRQQARRHAKTKREKLNLYARPYAR